MAGKGGNSFRDSLWKRQNRPLSDLRKVADEPISDSRIGGIIEGSSRWEGLGYPKSRSNPPRIASRGNVTLRPISNRRIGAHSPPDTTYMFCVGAYYIIIATEQ